MSDTVDCVPRSDIDETATVVPIQAIRSAIDALKQVGISIGIEVAKRRPPTGATDEHAPDAGRVDELGTVVQEQPMESK